MRGSLKVILNQLWQQRSYYSLQASRYARESLTRNRLTPWGNNFSALEWYNPLAAFSQDVSRPRVYKLGLDAALWPLKQKAVLQQRPLTLLTHLPAQPSIVAPRSELGYLSKKTHKVHQSWQAYKKLGLAWSLFNVKNTAIFPNTLSLHFSAQDRQAYLDVFAAELAKKLPDGAERRSLLSLLDSAQINASFLSNDFAYNLSPSLFHETTSLLYLEPSSVSRALPDNVFGEEANPSPILPVRVVTKLTAGLDLATQMQYGCFALWLGASSCHVSNGVPGSLKLKALMLTALN